MLKKRVLKRLLPLLFSFCCVFSGFLSVNVFADSISLDYTGVYRYADQIVLQSANNNTIDYTTGNIVNSNWISTSTLNEAISYVYDFNFNQYTYGLAFWFMNPWDFVYLPEVYDYYFVCMSYAPTHDFLADKIFVYYRDNAGAVKNVPYIEPDFTVHNITSSSYSGYQYSFKADFGDFSSISSISLLDRDGGEISDKLHIWFNLVPVPKGSSDDVVNSIISAINNQTSTLDGSIGEAADDVQQSIEDQYSGTPEEQLDIDSVITQHNEKMGVLSFGSDVMLQFLDMFQSANVGTAELTLPGFNITVENVEYSVWPDYSFNFEQLNEWVPALMSVIRVMLPAFVWLMVLRYCIKVFEDNFLAK